MSKICNRALTLIMGKVYHKQFIQKLVIFVLLLSGTTLSLSVYTLTSLTNIKVLDLLSGTDKKSGGLLKVHFLNIGQGDAIYIVTPNKNSMLIDSGPQNEKVITEVQKFKSMFDRQLDVLLATHADADHIGSMKKFIEKFTYQIFAYSGLSSDTKLFEELMSAVSGKNTKSSKDITLTAGMSIVLDEKNNIRFDVLFPDFDFQIGTYQKCDKREKEKEIEKVENKGSKNFKNNKSSKKSKTQKESVSTKIVKDVCLKYLSTETNLNSVVGKLSYGSTSFMLTGDAPMEVEKFIIEKYLRGNGDINSDTSNLYDTDFLKSDVLKLGHHGSKTSTSPEFLKAVLPTFAIVSAGKDNRYGHPHKRVLDAIAELGKSKSIKILKTFENGTIGFYSDGTTINTEL